MSTHEVLSSANKNVLLARNGGDFAGDRDRSVHHLIQSAPAVSQEELVDPAVVDVVKEEVDPADKEEVDRSVQVAAQAYPAVLVAAQADPPVPVPVADPAVKKEKVDPAVQVAAQAYPAVPVAAQADPPVPVPVADPAVKKEEVDPAVKKEEVDPAVKKEEEVDRAIPVASPADPAFLVAAPADLVAAPPLLVDLPLPERMVAVPKIVAPPVDPVAPLLAEAVVAVPEIVVPPVDPVTLPERIMLEELFEMEKKGRVSSQVRRTFYPYLEDDGTFLSTSAMEGVKGDRAGHGSSKTFEDFERFFK